MEIELGASLLSADFGHLADTIRRAERGGIDFIHIDVMDGYFTDFMTFGAIVIKTLRAVTQLPFDIHCYLVDPSRQIKKLAEAGADTITIHPETSPHLLNIIEKIKSYDVKAGIALEPATSPLIIKYILPEVNSVTLVTRDPSGAGGREFRPHQIDKIKTIKKMISNTCPTIHLIVDGGVNEKVAPKIVTAGATKLVLGSWLFTKSDFKQAITSLKNDLGRV
jgi:ribulose-phosphate 3-epimerase